MKQKIYPQEIKNEVQSIGQALKNIFDSQKSNLRTIAKFSDMSVNSVKAVLAGCTANIASYSLVAKALGTDLVTVVYDMKHKPTSLISTESKEEEKDPINDLLIQ